jgi:c(7)-type cytochrome triheme protein
MRPRVPISVEGRAARNSRSRWLVMSLCCLCVLCVSVVEVSRASFTAEKQRIGTSTRELFALMPQGPSLDYSNFKHTSQRHASLACTSCHERKDNSATPSFPGHKACISCHSGQFVTPNVPMCVICHTDVNSGNPPLKGFPTRFSDSFNVKFDHAQHMTGAARPASGCAACHTRTGGRAAALAIPASISAHNQCYSCHTPSSKAQSGREIASCGVCHEQKGYSRTTTSARSFRYAFSHAKHGSAQRLACADCHALTAGSPQSRQVSSPQPLEHFATTRGKTCLTCHNGRRSFGGDLAFRECRRCHTSATFKMPQ